MNNMFIFELNILMNKTDIVNGGGVDKVGQWHKIDINKIKNKLSGKKFNEIKKDLKWYSLGAYYWIYDKDFNDWFNKLNELIVEQQEAPTDSPIDKSESGEAKTLNKVDKKYNILVKANNTYNVSELKRFFANYPDLYNKAIDLATYQSNKVYYLPKQRIMDFKQLISQKYEKHEQYKQRIREEGKTEGKTEAQEEHNKEIEQLKEQHKEEIQEERKDKNNKVAEVVNKYKPVASSGPIDAVEQPKAITTTNNSPSIKDFIKNAYLNGDYKLGRDELRKRYTSGKYKQILKDVNIDNIINDVMLYSELEITKKKNKLAQLAQIGAFSPETMANMDTNTQEEINNAIIAKSRIDNANKRLKYKLPINKPKAKQAMLNAHINPMLFRGAFSTGNY